MAKYQIYGIGNALVDAEFSVEDHFLEKMNIEKGLMTLVNDQRQEEILRELSQPQRACGGSAANTVIAARQFGASAYYSCKVADDEMGRFYLKNLAEHGVQSNQTQEPENGVTGKCLVLVTPDAQRTMNTFLGITARFSYREISESDLRESEYLYIEGYLVASPTAKEAAVKAREFAENHNVKTSLTLSDPNMTEYFTEGLREMIGKKVNLLFCNEAEAKSFTKCSELNHAKEALKKFADTFAITLGERGALLWSGETFFEVASPKVNAVDSNGAGDMFAGAFISQLTQGKTFKEAGEFACRAASEIVTHFGPRLTDERAKALL